MRRFSKKLAFALAAAMVLVTAAPAAQAKAADDFTLNRSAATLYVNKGVNDAGKVEGLAGNVQKYDFNLKNKPADWATAYTYAWSTSNDKVATVTKGGVTTAVGIGKATISCVITDKATGNVASTLKATVTVKANAADVEITNADKYNDTVVEVGSVVDLNRTLVDADGNKNATKGKVATDLTKWVAEPATGVEINQANGQFTFTKDAVAGDYSLYCYTYQSDKYNQATATSEKVNVTLADSVFEVKQNTVKTFTINFDSAVKTLGEVTVTRLLEANGATYEYPQVVKSATLAKDGMSATVEVFSALQNNVNYVINVTGYDAYTLTASAGAPATMTISSAADSVSPFVNAGAEAKLYYKLYDAKGVDVTTGTETVLFNAKEYSTDGSYYVAGDLIWFVKSGLSTTVVAEYQSGKFENGVQVGNVKAEFDFVSVDKAPVTVKGVADATVGDFANNKTLSFPMGDAAALKVKIAKSEGDPVEVTTNGQDIGVGKITFETVSPQVLALNGTQLVVFNQGTAAIVVNLVTKDANGADVVTPIGVVNVTVTAPRALTTVAVDKALVTVGTATGYTTETVTLTAKDQYGADVAITGVTFTGANDAATGVLAGVSYIGDKKIQLDGSLLGAALKDATAIQLTFKAKVNDSKEVAFSALVKKANDNANTNYLAIETAGFGEVARTVDSKNAKAATFSVFVMNNGIKTGMQDVAKYDANNIVKDSYYFKVTKNGTDVTNNATVSGGVVTVNFSGLEAVSNGAVTGSAVKYDLGAGNYVFTLYKGIESGANKVLVQQQSATGVATCTTGSYSAATRTSETAAAATQEAVRACFSVKDTKGNEATAPYFVKMNANATGYIYVESITFYDDLGNGEFAAYTVNVGVALKK